MKKEMKNTTKRNETPNINLRRILGIDQPVVPDPQKDGIVPSVGSKVRLYEKKFMTKGETFLDMGEYIVVNKTKFLIICDKISKNGAVHSSSFRITDFKSGIITFNNVDSNILSVAK